MPHKLIVRAALAIVLSAVAVPAFAQAALKGRVLNDQKKPVIEANVVATCVSVSGLQPQATTTDARGNFTISGLQFGKWNVVITKGNTYWKSEKDINLMPGLVEDLGDVMMKPMPAGMVVASGKGDGDASSKKNAEIQAKIKGADEDLAAGKFDDALTKLDAVSKDIPKCAPCSARMGVVYQKKGDLPNAEKSFLQAIEWDPNMADAYGALATIYNAQQKFDDALKMTAKAKELSTAQGGAADPVAAFNEGVVLWNAGKTAEAEAAFKKATELNPKNAAAFYQLGVAQVSSGKNAEAIKSLEQYIALDPKGKDVETAKAIIASIKY